jgi:CMP-N-acetylneuraminic acid synthetase
MLIKKVLGFIPARSGSKGVPNKNIQPIKNIPLLEYSVFSAIKAKEKGYLSDVVVSTDSQDYLSILHGYNIEKEYIRPKKISGDSSPTIDSVMDVLKWYEKYKLTKFDAVMILQPTTPFRTPEHIREAIILMNSDLTLTCVASICKLADHHPLRIKRLLSNGQLVNFCHDYAELEPSRRQDFNPDAYIRNGAIYLTKVKDLESTGLIRGSKVAGMVMPEANSINIDEHMDYIVAKESLDYDAFSSDLSFFQKLINKE